MDIDYFKELIKEDKDKAGSYAKLSKLTSIGTTTLHVWVTGIKSAPDIINIIEYVKHLDCPPERKALYFESCGYPVPVEFGGGETKSNVDLVRTISDDNMVSVPIVGSVHAGEADYAYTDIEEYMYIDKSMLRDNENHFLLRIKGDCMDLAGLPEGSLALISVERQPENGQIAVFRCGDDTVIRKYTKENGVVVLLPESSNKDNKPIVLTGSEEWVVVGTAIAVIGKLI